MARTRNPLLPSSTGGFLKDQRNEAEIQAAIKRLLKAVGFSFWDTSQPFRARITPGVADLFVAGRGVTCWIEVKAGYNKQTPEQIEFQRKVEENGGRYFVARHEQDVADWINDLTERLIA